MDGLLSKMRLPFFCFDMSKWTLQSYAKFYEKANYWVQKYVLGHICPK